MSKVQMTNSPMLSERSPHVTVCRRSSARFLAAVIRNPLEALPPECFRDPVVFARVLGRGRLYLTEPELIHDVFVRRASHLEKGPIFRRVLGAALGDGMLTADGERWRAQRAAAAPAFSHGRLLGFIPAMLAAAEHARDRWLAAGSNATLDLGHEMMMTTFAIVADTMLSGSDMMDVARVEHAVATYLRSAGWFAAYAIVGLPDGTPFPGRRRALASAAYLRQTVRAMVAVRRAEAPRDDLVTLLLAAVDPETHAAMSDGGVADNLLTFIAAGHETTAQGLTWTLRILADRPDIVSDILVEVERVTGGGRLQAVHVPELGYTRQVFSEALRLFPPVATVERRVASDFPLTGFTVPEGTVVIAPTFALHRRPELWLQPELFDPDRFSPERVNERQRYAYLPFGVGPRSCIGSGFAMLEGVAILAVLLRALRLVPLAPEMPRPTMRITVRPDRPVLMRWRPR